MTIAAVCAGIVALANGQSIVVGSETFTVKAFDPPPGKVPDTAEMPMLYVYSGAATYGRWTSDEGIEDRAYSVRVAWRPAGQATPQIIEAECRAAIVALRNRFASYPQLGGVAGVLNSVVVADSGPVPMPDYSNPETVYLGFTIDVRVTEIIGRTLSE